MITDVTIFKIACKQGEYRHAIVVIGYLVTFLLVKLPLTENTPKTLGLKRHNRPKKVFEAKSSGKKCLKFIIIII